MAPGGFTLRLPVPIGTLDERDQHLWTPTIHALRVDKMIVADPMKYWNEFKKVYSMLEVRRRAIDQLPLVTVHDMPWFVWRSGADAHDGAHYQCNAYPFEAIMTLHACACALWNAANLATDKPTAVRLLFRASGIFQFISSGELKRWHGLPLDQIPPECSPLFTEAMQLICLGEVHRLLAQIRLEKEKSQEEVSSPFDGHKWPLEKPTWMILQAASEYFLKATSLFGNERLASTLPEGYMTFANHQHAFCHVSRVMGQVWMAQHTASDMTIVGPLLRTQLRAAAFSALASNWLESLINLYGKSSFLMGVGSSTPLPQLAAIKAAHMDKTILFDLSQMLDMDPQMPSVPPSPAPTVAPTPSPSLPPAPRVKPLTAVELALTLKTLLQKFGEGVDWPPEDAQRQALVALFQSLAARLQVTSKNV